METLVSWPIIRLSEKPRHHVGRLHIIFKIRHPIKKEKFLLIGDSGERDPEIYAQIMRQRPDQIICIAIRRAGNDSKDRWAAAFEGIEESKWIVFNEPIEFSRFAAAHSRQALLE